MPTTTVNGRRLHFVDDGLGDDVVVLVHAFPLDSRMWEPQVRALSQRCHVIAPDLAGFGQSAPPGDAPGDYSVEAWSDDVISLIGTLAVEQVTLVGASVGADVALSVVRRARELVGALALVGPRPEQGPDDEFQWSEQVRWIEQGGDLGAIVDRMLDVLVSERSATRSETLKLLRWMIEGTSRDAWVGGFEALRRRPDPSADLHKIDVPTLVIAGEDDVLVPPSAAEEIAGRVPGAGVIKLADAGHLPNLDTPVLFTRAIEDLLAGRQARRASGKHPWPAAPATERTG